MYKLIENSWEFNDPPLRIIKRSDKGLVKQAKWYIDYKSEPGCTYVNALFLGADGYYGCNRNGDSFEESELIDHHKSFLTANHFKHHKNDDPDDSYGKVSEVFYNPDMHRVEGIIKIFNDRSPDMIGKIEKGLSIPLSMACKVPYDVCSICGHKSKTIDEYCDDLKFDMCQILKDGRKVRAFNPRPQFFDISEVAKGADPTAFTLRKVANDKSIRIANDDNQPIGFDKKSICEKLSAIEKELIALVNPPIEAKALAETTPIDPSKLDIKAMAKAGVAISVRDFGVKGKCAVFNSLVLEKLPNIVYDNSNDCIFDIEKRSLLSKYACDRMLSNSLHKVPIAIMNNDPRDIPIMQKVAAINLAIISENPALLHDQLFTRLMILQNCV